MSVAISRLGSIAILGASRGIGRAIALELAKCGAQHLHLVARNTAALKSLDRELDALSVETNVTLHGRDLSSPKDQAEFMMELEDAEEFPRHWIFCAGGSVDGIFKLDPFERLDLEKHIAQLRFNLEMPIALTHRLLPELLRPLEEAERAALESENLQGTLLYFSSMASYRAISGAAVYSAAKRGLNAFAETLFEEVREQGIRVGIISPGMVDTPLHPQSPNLDADKMIASQDIAQLVSSWLALPPRCCPLELKIAPQRSPKI